MLNYRMTLICTLYILIVVFAENKGKSHAQCASALKETRVVHLSLELNAECFLLLNATTELITEQIGPDKTNYEVQHEDVYCLPTTSKVYLIDLERWINDYPNRKESGERSIMKFPRKLLEYSDLVLFTKENQRPVNLLDAEDYHLVNMLGFPEHIVTRRRRSKNNKHLSTKKRKVKRKNTDKEHSKHPKIQKKGTHGAILHAVGRKTRKLKKKENKSHEKKCHLRQHQSLYISILFVVVFIILCLVAAYYLYRRSRLKARGTRFKYTRNGNKEDKNTLTDYVEWNNEASCTCSDIDTGNVIKCPLCNRFYQSASDNCNKYLSSVGVPKSKDKEKKKLFNFLQKSLQDKKKQNHLGNQDWKKADRKAVLKKQEKFASTLPGDRQCACCKCNLHIRDKIICEKNEHKRKVLQKLKAKTRKEKKKRKDEIRKAKKYANICFEDNCK